MCNAQALLTNGMLHMGEVEEVAKEALTILLNPFPTNIIY
jgi:hypothetical protein